MGNDISAMTLTALSVALKQRKISAVEATRACLTEIEKNQPRINCFISIEAEAALEQASQADREIGQGKWRGALHGVPLAHKDMFYRAGKVSTCGAKIYRNQTATVTATVHERLGAAGALYLGGLNMAEFAAGPTGHNEFFGDCRNPWNLTHIPGGSSSGSGAAVAGRIVYGAMGSDTGGSIRTPAAMCGVVGLKPTYGLVSRYGAMPRCWSLDVIGPLTRTVEDCALLLQTVAGHDERDPVTVRYPIPDYCATLRSGIRGITVGVPINASFAEVHEEVRQALNASVRELEALGARVELLELPDPRVIYGLTNVINKAEAATIHAHWIKTRREDYSLSAVNRIEAGFHIPATHYLDATRSRGRLLANFVDRVFDRVDVVHLPVIGIPVPTLEETRIRSTEKVPELMERLTRYTRWINYLGLPALSVPCGFTGKGLPIAFQLLGRPFSEAKLLRVGRAYQDVTDWHNRLPPQPQPT